MTDRGKCCDKVSEGSVWYNPLNDVVQCHACGTTWVTSMRENDMSNTDEQTGVDWSVVAETIISSAALASTDGQITKCQYCGFIGRGTDPTAHSPSCVVLAARRLLDRVASTAPIKCKGGCVYSRSMHQPYPRHCVQCGHVEKEPTP